MKQSKGFTLVELIVVIGIIVILAAILIAALNPNELIKRARDTRRMNDLAALNRALAFYLADVDYPNLTNSSTPNAGCTGTVPAIAYLSASSSISISGWTTTTRALRTVDGNGWVPVNFTSITGGSPLGQLPVDPLNDNKYFYIYACSINPALTYELNARLESSKYIGLMASTSDGGNNDNAYEVGTKLDILPNFTWP
jgi:prepilin-type N-terminal cleavage/methylation domain-containing protein